MMKQFKTLLFMVVMALAVMTWASWSPAMAYDEVDDTAVEETMDQEEETFQEYGTDEENVEEDWNDQEVPETETQEESPYAN